MRLPRLTGGGRLPLWAAIALVVSVVLVAGLLPASTATAAPPANVANAQRCLHGGWKTLFTLAGQPFKNQGACIVYALRDGVFGSAGGGE